jgi:hypothetical protein
VLPQNRKRQIVDIMSGADLSDSGSGEQRNSSGTRDSRAEFLVISRIGCERKIHVEEDPVGAGSCQTVDELCIGPTRPGPIADFVERLVIDHEQNDVAAGLMRMKAVAGDAQPILCDLAKADQTENQPGKGCPQK